MARLNARTPKGSVSTAIHSLSMFEVKLPATIHSTKKASTPTYTIRIERVVAASSISKAPMKNRFGTTITPSDQR